MKKTFLAIVLLFSLAIAKAQTVNEQLMAAVKLKNAGVAEQLLKTGADANYFENKNNFKVSVLIIAIVNDDVPTVKLLVDHKANVNWRDGFDDTALMYAAQKGNTIIISYLLDHGADIHAKDVHGNTVISAAKEGKHDDAIRLIQSRLN